MLPSVPSHFRYSGHRPRCRNGRCPSKGHDLSRCQPGVCWRLRMCRVKLCGKLAWQRCQRTSRCRHFAKLQDKVSCGVFPMPAPTNFELSGWLTLGSPYLSSYGVLQNNLQSLRLLRTFQPWAVGSSRLLCCRSSRVSKLFREAIKGAMGQWATFYLLHSDP